MHQQQSIYQIQQATQVTPYFLTTAQNIQISTHLQPHRMTETLKLLRILAHTGLDAVYKKLSSSYHLLIATGLSILYMIPFKQTTVNQISEIIIIP